MTQLKREGDNSTRFLCPQSCFDDVGVGTDQENDVAGGRFGEEVGVYGSGGGEGEELGVFATDRGETDVCVLEVRSGVAFE